MATRPVPELPAPEPSESAAAESGDGATATPRLRPLAGTERAIFEAARDLLADGGLAGLSMRALAARVGTTPTAIYHYFQNKDDLVQQVVERGFRQFETNLREAIDDLPEGSLDRIVALGEAYLRFAVEQPQYFRITFGIQAGRPRELDEVPARGGYDVLRRSVSEAMEAGSIRPADPDVVALYLWSIVHGLVTIFMACDCESMIEETDISVPADVEPARHLFREFRAFVENGLSPTTT